MAFNKSAWSLMRGLLKRKPDIAEKLKAISKNTALGSWGRRSLDAAVKGLASKETKTNDLKINKTPKASLASLADSATAAVVRKTDEKKENTKQPSLASVATKDKKKTTSSKATLASTPKKKEKKPLSLGAATINV